MKIITKTPIFLFAFCFFSVNANAQLASDQAAPTVKTEAVQKLMSAPPAQLASAAKLADTAAAKNEATKNIKAINEKAQQLMSSQGVIPATKPQAVKTEKIQQSIPSQGVVPVTNTQAAKIVLPVVSTQTKE